MRAAAALAARLDAVGRDPSAADFEIAAAKLRANRAVGVVTAVAHQVHGAIGFTEEYDLHRVTIPLMRWRSAHGNDAYWAQRLGRHGRWLRRARPLGSDDRRAAPEPQRTAPPSRSAAIFPAS